MNKNTTVVIASLSALSSDEINSPPVVIHAHDFCEKILRIDVFRYNPVIRRFSDHLIFDSIKLIGYFDKNF